MRLKAIIGFASILVAGAVAVAVVWQFLGSQLEPVAEAKRIDAHDAEQVSLGKRIYKDHCASCHGANLEGEPGWRSRKADGRLPAPPHDASGHTWHHTDDVLFQMTKFGPAALVGGGYQSDMPPFEGILSDQEILTVLAFIKSTWPGEIRARHDQMNKEISQGPKP